MSEPKFNRGDPDAESMFDFLAEEDVEKHRRKKRAAGASERSLPIIRKPVPVSKSGPLLPPKPGAPVEPPLALTGRFAHTDDELDFLSDVPDTSPHGQSAERSRKGKPDTDSNITRLDSIGRQTRDERNRPSRSGTERVRRKAPGYRNNEFDDLDLDLDLRGAPEFNRNRHGVSGLARHDYHDEGRAPRRRGRWFLLALLLIAVGAGSFLVTNPDNWREIVQKVRTDIAGFTAGRDSDSSAATVPDVDLTALDGEVRSAVSPMMQKFRDQLSLLEGLVADGALDEAERVLATMDRTTYGYGAAEFGDLEKRIEQLKSGVAVTDTASEQAERDEAARVEAEQAAQAESERLAAAEQTAREEEARRVAEAVQAAREEEARRIAEAEQAAQEQSARQAAAEQSAREAQAKAAEQQAAQEQQAKLDAEKSRQESARLERERLAARTSEWPSLEADRQATDRRIAAERAAIQRQQARAQRLVEAREREEALVAAQGSSSQGPSQGPAEDEPSGTADTADNADKVASGLQNISDDELQTVYRRFIDLQQAVSGRDINAVVSLTQRSGARVQQLMQIFENSTQIDARIRNVSTSNATGQIKGTLQINRIQRADGTFVPPPAALSSISLSSKREGDGWSAIAW